MGRHLSPRYDQVILVSGTLFWQLSIDHNIDVQLVFSWAPKLARKCESKHWFPCGADGRSAVGRCTVTWLPNFLGWVDLLSYGASPTRGASRQEWSSAIKIFITSSNYLLVNLVSRIRRTVLLLNFSPFSPWKLSSTAETVTVQAKRRKRARWTFEVILPHRNHPNKLHTINYIEFGGAFIIPSMRCRASSVFLDPLLSRAVTLL